MPTVPLPNDPSSEQLRKQAKELRDRARAGDPDALALIAEHHPDRGPDGEHVVSLSAAQLVVARQYGFASWARLKRHLDVVEQYSRAPDDVAPSTDPVHEFLRLACLEYGRDDAPAAWSDARAVLAAHPELARASIHVAAADCDLDAVRAPPGARSGRGEPARWPDRLGAAPVPRVRAPRARCRRRRGAGRGAPAAGARRRSERGLPLARHLPVHRAHRRVRRR